MKLFHRLLFREQSGGTCSQPRHTIIIFGIDGNANYNRLWPLCLNPCRRLDAIHFGHIDVHHDDLGPQLLHQTHSL